MGSLHKIEAGKRNAEKTHFFEKNELTENAFMLRYLKNKIVKLGHDKAV